MADNIHKGHRGRMKKMIEEAGLEVMSDHRALEALLFYAVPQKDLAATAHALLEEFGSFSAVFEASKEDLMKVSGIGPHSASLIKIVLPMAQRYQESKTSDNDIIFNNPSELIKYAKSRFMGKKVEEVHVTALDSQFKLIKSEVIAKGDLTRAVIDYKELLNFITKTNAYGVVISHNHINGIALPSRADIMTTNKIVELLNAINVRLVDHVIVAKTEATSLRNTGYIESTEG